MKVLLLSTRPLGAAAIDRVLLAGLHPSAVDVCPQIHLALARIDAFPPDLVIVNLAEPDASEAVQRLQARGVQMPVVVVAPASARTSDADVSLPAAVRANAEHHAHACAAPSDGHDGGLLTRQDRSESRAEDHAPGPPREGRTSHAVLADGRQDFDALDGSHGTELLDAETRWLLYDVASIGHVSTTAKGEILAANDVAGQLLGQFLPGAFEVSGELPRPLLDAAGAYARRPSRFELCLQRGAEGPLHWIVGLALPHAGMPATVTWFLIDVSEQRLHARRSRFLRRMDALTHVLSAAAAECSTLVDTGGRALAAAREPQGADLEVEGAMQALSRTQAVLTQLAGFARRRGRRPALSDLRTLLDQISPVLVHVTGDDVSWTMSTGIEPLYASLDASELEQCLAAIVTQGREALPLGGQMALSLSATMRQDSAQEGRGARPEITVTIELQGYGLQPVTVPATVQTLILRLGADFTTEHPDHLTTRLMLRLPRVFITP